MITVSSWGIQPVQAAIININSRTNNPANPVVAFLMAGNYQVEYIGIAEGGTYDGWNAWGNVAGCDGNGANCQNGWLNGYSISASNFSISQFSTGTYATPALALANGQNTSFSLITNSNVNFFVEDTPFSDNTGGISLRITPIIASTPEPSSTLGLIALGVFGLGTTLKRKL